MVIIRPERQEHEAGVRLVETQAFGRSDEADLVDGLRVRGAITLSLVAVEDGLVVGHILFSPVAITDDQETYQVRGLGPLAVLPERQKQGIGARLVRAGIEECRQAGAPAVVVLGNPRYYMRFDFEPAKRFGIRFMDERVPQDAFMVIELRRGSLQGHQGVAYYQAEFNNV